MTKKRHYIDYVVVETLLANSLMVVALSKSLAALWITLATISQSVVVVETLTMMALLKSLMAILKSLMVVETLAANSLVVMAL
jgi:archaellum biogenesis ATPase FlaH